MPDWLLPILLVDLALTAAVVAFVIRRRMAASAGDMSGDQPSLRAIANFGAVTEFAKSKHERIGEYVRANWSGAPEQLPGVVRTLLDELEREAQSRNLPLDREIMKTLIAHSLRAHRIGRGSEVRNAIERVG